jgi:hypothetical protein
MRSVYETHFESGGPQGTVVDRKVVGRTLFSHFSAPKWGTGLDFTAVMILQWEDFRLPRLNVVLPQES